jgi:hypothetical protein
MTPDAMTAEHVRAALVERLDIQSVHVSCQGDDAVELSGDVLTDGRRDEVHRLVASLLPGRRIVDAIVVPGCEGAVEAEVL